MGRYKEGDTVWLTPQFGHKTSGMITAVYDGPYGPLYNVTSDLDGQVAERVIAEELRPREPSESKTPQRLRTKRLSPDYAPITPEMARACIEEWDERCTVDGVRDGSTALPEWAPIMKVLREHAKKAGYEK